MKFKVHMKDPDSLYDAVKDAAIDELNEIEGLDDEDKECMLDRRIEKYNEIASLWFRNSEYLTVEIDTEEKTCTVVKVDE